jgi:phenylpropionate dioxygenase-like ring-hydroxylating dioxygenase large terminal subunit
MDRCWNVALVREVFRHMEAKTTDLAPGVMRHPVSLYRDVEHAAKERVKLFRALPLAVAHGTELPRAGDFRTVDAAGVPILLVRQGDGSVKAFVNVCRHRGARLECEARGNRRGFDCSFHGWSYDLDGRLGAINFPEGFPGVDAAERSLVELPAEERHGLVWVVPSRGGRIDVAGFLGEELDRELGDWHLDRAAAERIAEFETRSNWKLVMDGFLEDYHLPILHRRTVGPYFKRNLHLFRGYERHGRLIAVRAKIREAETLSPEDVDLRRHALFIYVLVPNSVLIWQIDHFQLWTIYPHPKEEDRCRTSVRFLIPSAEQVERDRSIWDKNWTIITDTVKEEDWPNAEGIQAGLDMQETFVFGRNEPALQHFHRSLARELAPSVEV